MLWTLVVQLTKVIGIFERKPMLYQVEGIGRVSLGHSTIERLCVALEEETEEGIINEAAGNDEKLAQGLVAAIKRSISHPQPEAVRMEVISNFINALLTENAEESGPEEMFEFEPAALESQAVWLENTKQEKQKETFITFLDELKNSNDIQNVYLAKLIHDLVYFSKQVVMNKDKNKMTSENCAIVFSPVVMNLLNISPGESHEQYFQLVEIFKQIFKEIIEDDSLFNQPYDIDFNEAQIEKLKARYREVYEHLSRIQSVMPRLLTEGMSQGVLELQKLLEAANLKAEQAVPKERQSGGSFSSIKRLMKRGRSASALEHSDSGILIGSSIGALDLESNKHRKLGYSASKSYEKERSTNSCVDERAIELAAIENRLLMERELLQKFFQTLGVDVAELEGPVLLSSPRYSVTKTTPRGSEEAPAKATESMSIEGAVERKKAGLF